MKRLFLVILTLALLLALAAPALADVAYVPRDRFLENHQSECSYENRGYYANGGDGLVMVWDSPAGSPKTALPNGNLFHVSWVYNGSDGGWGCIFYDPETKLSAWEGEGSDSGWVKMSDMLAEYDYRAFDADHRSEIVSEERTLTAEAGKVFQLYRYPGSGEVVSTIDSGWVGVGESIVFNQLFTDPAGRTWGFLGYLFGHRNAWICLDDPFNDALPADENCVTLRFTQPAPATDAAPDAAEPTSPQTSTIDDTKVLQITAPASDEAVEAASKAAQKTGVASLVGAGGVVVIALAVLVEVLRRKRARKY